ncbi:hypothetical protein BN946_scf184844.g109 [Trametes cinnabarina]|uniref:RRM domain-containing protein n=1 Tax=Pycnoporus cinnabarinus TaxID=5643 RepID=A0A060S9T0_PYCCI|nr:hypothetical protein BN946_scf184844.g109 [Trametes cinnabarina]
MSAQTPSPLTIGKGHVQPPAKCVYDKRRMGIYEDKGNIGSFDVSNLTLQPSSTSDLPPPQLSRTIVLAHLPKKFRVRTFVNTWARRFGTVHRIEVDAKLGKALVEYASPSEAQAAFASSRLRGEGKEHIRVYWYQGPAMKSSASTSPSGHPHDVEEGEIEEGEVVESPVAFVKPKKKKQKAKKEKESQTVRQRSPSASNATNTALSSAPVVDDVPQTVVPLPGPPLEERLSEVPAAVKGVWEEEMELDSDGDYRNEQSLSPALLATTIESSPDDMDLEEWEADMDVEESSPARELSTSLPLAVLPNDVAAESSGSALKRPRSPSLTPDVGSRSGPTVASVEDRRLYLQLEIEQQKIGAVLASSTSTAESSSGVPTTPEPATPSDWSVNARISVAPSDSEILVEGRHAVALPLRSEDNKPVPDLDKLAESFICESIQAVAAPVVPSKASSAASAIPVLSRMRINRSVPLVSPSTSSLPRRISSPVPHASAISPLFPALSSPVSSMSSAVPASEAVQLLAKKKRLEEYIAMTKNLLAKISAAKSKAEKDSLMRILKEKQRVMDLELQEGTASPSTPGARVINAMSTPTSMAKLFRWPDTPRELIIEISDDEADDMLSNTPSAVGPRNPGTPPA